MPSEMEAVLHAHLTQAEEDRDRYRAALERIANADITREWRWLGKELQAIAREALEGVRDGD